MGTNIYKIGLNLHVGEDNWYLCQREAYVEANRNHTMHHRTILCMVTRGKGWLSLSSSSASSNFWQRVEEQAGLWAEEQITEAALLYKNLFSWQRIQSCESEFIYSFTEDIILFLRPLFHDFDASH